jgi:type II secretory pathway component PulL
LNPAVILQVGLWLKENWTGLVFAVVVVGFMVHAWQQSKKIDEMARQSEEEFARHTENLAEVRTLYETEHQQQEEINLQYSKELQRLSETYSARLAELESRVTTRRQRFIQETGGQPQEMADRVRERLGWIQQQ